MRFDWRKITAWFIPIAFVVVVIYDVIAYSNGGYEATISCKLLDASLERQVIAFAPGFLMGHLYWPRGDESWRRALLNAGMVLAYAAITFLVGAPITLVALLSGIPFGYLFWPQHRKSVNQRKAE